MKITRTKKILLALLLALCLGGTDFMRDLTCSAQAADFEYIYDPETRVASMESVGSGSGLTIIWDDYTKSAVTVEGTTDTYTYQDAEGSTRTSYTYKVVDLDTPGTGQITVNTELNSENASTLVDSVDVILGKTGDEEAARLTARFNYYFDGETEDSYITNDIGISNAENTENGLPKIDYSGICFYGPFDDVINSAPCAIYNIGPGSDIGTISAGFIKLEDTAIANMEGATIDSIAGSYFMGNTETETGIVVNTSSIGTIVGSYFIGNTGGAIANNEGGTIGGMTENYFVGNAADTNGGAIYNSSSSIESIDESYFVANEAGVNGGAIYNDGTVASIAGSYFVDNTAESGGSVYNAGTVTSIEGSSFVGNLATEAGAIYNDESGTIGEITGSYFAENAADSAGVMYNKGIIGIVDGDDSAGYGGITNSYFVRNTTTAGGGAIYNTGTITSITGSYFVENVAESGNGGGIYNEGSIGCDADGNVTGGISDSVFQGNEATSGGAIYNAGTISSITNSSFIDNKASGNGGAIYSAGDLSIVADGADVVFQGNTSGSDSNAIYMATDADSTASTVYFELSNGGSITLSDNVRGEDIYDAEISGDGLDTTFYLLNDLYDANLSVGNTTLDTIDNEAHAYNVNTFTVKEDFDMVADVDLANEEMDRFATNNDGEADHSGTLNVSGVNLISDAENKSTKIFFAEEGLKDNVTSSVGVAYTPVYQYSVNYDDRDDAGYFVIDRTGFNPAVMATPVAAMGAYNAFGLMFDYNFEHSDYFMKLPAEDRLALSEEQKKAKRAPKESDATKPAYYNQNELTERGAWMRAFAANESVDYGGGWESRDKYYGAMVGFDSDMHVSDNGWASVLTGYAGMLGIRQSYSGGNIRQKGGFVGLTESFYKKNFYTAWTIAAGTTKAHEYTMYGHDNSRFDEYGIAGRFGWNIKLGDGKFSLLPTFTASFTYINPEDYTNAGGVHISGDGFYAVQLNPNLKFILNMENGWQPYLTVGEVWTVGETSKMYANEYKLDELDLDPYTEYGIGVQKRWANEKDAYVQVLGHSHGRDGILVNAGIRWNF